MTWRKKSRRFNSPAAQARDCCDPVLENPMNANERELTKFFAKYTPEIASLGRALLKKLRSRLPLAVQMVYDNYNALVIGFGPNDRPSEALLSMVLYPRYISLCFLQGAKLSDPKKLLEGSGKQVRHIRLPDVKTLDKPDVEDLIERAWSVARQSPGADGDGRLIIKSISAKQRPRRPA